jgi:EpsD family peptidyl-prolyl cis-trans isomerase
MAKTVLKSISQFASIRLIGPTIMGSVLILSGCGKSVNTGQTTQTIARAGGTEITVHELKHGLAGTAPGSMDERKFLESMVDQTLMARKAVEEGMDKDPKVSLSIAAAKRAILAQSYAEKAVGKQAPPTEIEMRQYYDKNPELFSQRKIYAIRDIGLPTAVATVEAVREAIKSVKTLEELEARLAKNNKATGTGSKAPGTTAPKTPSIRERVAAAEDMPPEVRKAMQTLRVGGMGLIAMKDRIQVIHMVNAQQAPIDFNSAKPSIQRMLFAQTQRQTLENLVMKLREEGKVEYLGDFAKSAASKMNNSGPSDDGQLAAKQ